MFNTFFRYQFDDYHRLAKIAVLIIFGFSINLRTHSTNANASVVGSPELIQPAWSLESNQIGGHLNSVSAAGDINNDGYADIIVAAPNYDNDQVDEGRVWVFYGSASGLGTTHDWMAEGNQVGAEFGWAVASAGDVNNDGYDDIIIGANYFDNGQADEGKVFAYYGSATGLGATADWTAEINQAIAEFGNAVSTAGDINNDGYDDVIVGARYYNNGLPYEGRAYAFYGSSTGLSPTPNWFVDSNQTYARFGNSLGAAGDVNGDGYDDVIVGAQWYTNGQTDEGKTFVYYGSSIGLSTTPNWTAEGNQVDAQFGSSANAAGDVNNDGYADVVVGAFYFDGGQIDEGKLFVYLGSSTGLSSTPIWEAESDQAQAVLGWSAGTAGDVNADGYADLVASAAWYDSDQLNEGRVFVYLGSSSGLSLSPTWIAESNQSDSWFGGVSTAGDVNGDGNAEILVGAPLYDGGQTDEGQVYLYDVYSQTSFLSFDKSASSPTAAPGQTLTYTLMLTATGPTSIPVTLTDTLPSGLTYVTGTVTGGATFSNGAIHFNGNVPAGGAWTITYRATVNAGLAPGSILANTALVSYTIEGNVYQQERSAAVSIPNTLPFAHLVLIYANGDNNLSARMLALLNNAELSANNANAVTLMLLDGPGADDAWLYKLQGDVDESCPNYVNPTCDGRYVLGQTAWRWSDDTANAYSLNEFLKGAVRAYPSAGQILLSLVGHGSGLYPDVVPGQPSGWDGKPGGLLWDEHPGSYLNTRDLGRALRWAKQATGRSVDLLYLDACLMAMAEVADEVSDSAHYILASENWSWASFPYDAYLSPSVLNGTTTPAAIGVAWLGIEANRLRTIGDYPFTLSLIDASKMPNVRASVEALAVALSSTLPSGHAQIESAHTAAICFDSAQDGPIDANDNYCDLKALARHLAAQFAGNPTVVSAAQDVQNAVADAILVEDHNNGVPWMFPAVTWAWEPDLGGLSIYAPFRADDWKRKFYDGDNFRFAQGGQWGAFLDAFWGNAEPPPPPPCPTCEPPTGGILPIIAHANGGHDNIQVSWEWGDTVTDTTGLAGYRIYRSENGGTYTSLTPTPIAANQYEDALALVAGSEYCYQIKAVNGANTVIGQSNLACATFGELVLWMPDLAAAPATTNTIVPVNLANGDGLCIAAAEITLSYSPTIALANGVVSPTIYTAGYEFIANTTVTGEVSIAAISAQCQPLYGAGTLFNVGFSVLGSTGQVGPLTFLTGLTYTVIYDDSDLINPVPLALENGSLAVSNAYTRGDVNGDGAVNVADAALALRIASGAVTPSPQQQTACDVNGDSACTAADATLILCYAAYGNWGQCGAPNAASRDVALQRLYINNVVTITLGAVSGGAGQTVTVPINLANGPEFAGGTFTFSYDPTRMTFAGVTLPPLVSGFSAQSHVLQPGLVRVALARNTTLNADGAMLNLQFALINMPTPLGLADVRLNDSDGRDFETSALQKTIVVAQASAGYRVFLPVVVR